MTFSGYVSAGCMVLAIHYIVEDKWVKALHTISLMAAVMLSGYIEAGGFQ